MLGRKSGHSTVFILGELINKLYLRLLRIGILMGDYKYLGRKKFLGHSYYFANGILIANIYLPWDPQHPYMSEQYMSQEKLGCYF